MAVRFNPDGTITVGVIRDEEPKPVKAEAPTEEKKTPPKKKATKTTKKKAE